MRSSRGRSATPQHKQPRHNKSLTTQPSNKQQKAKLRKLTFTSQKRNFAIRQKLEDDSSEADPMDNVDQFLGFDKAQLSARSRVRRAIERDISGSETSEPDFLKASLSGMEGPDLEDFSANESFDNIQLSEDERHLADKVKDLNFQEPHPSEDMKPFIIKKSKRQPGDKLETSAPGVRLHTFEWEKYKDNPKYNIQKASTGYYDWYDADAVLTPQNGIIRDYYTKKYQRDPATREATLPERFKKSVNYDELQKILQKADHYFFEDRPCPPAQLLVPLRDPRTVLPNSPISTMVSKLEKKHNVGLPYALDKEQRELIEKTTRELTLPRMRNDKEVMSYLQDKIDEIYDGSESDEEYLNRLNSIDQREPNMTLVSGQYFTAQMRRAEFWRKYLEIFTYVDLLYTTTVRCTRAVGRVSSAAALVIMGNGHGIFSYGRGKASDNEQAVRIALLKTRRNVLFTPLHENRTPYYSVVGKFKASTIFLGPQARGVGLRAGRLTFTLLECIGYKDASAKLRGRPNIWNIVRAWMECLKYQESYREVANMRGQHYQQMLNPWTKAPPIPSREEVQEMEDVAAQAFKEAVIDVFKSRQLFETDTFKDIKPHFTERANFEQKWDRYLDMANIPQSLRLYPGFSEYLDASKLVHDKRFREEIVTELEDAWSPTETDEAHDNSLKAQLAQHKDENGISLLESHRENPLRYRTARDDQPYYQFYRDVEKPTFNRKAMRFTAINNHLEDMATTSYTRAVGAAPEDMAPQPFVFPTDAARAAYRQSTGQAAVPQ
jgi:small subunit ribosomal protein S5